MTDQHGGIYEAMVPIPPSSTSLATPPDNDDPRTTATDGFTTPNPDPEMATAGVRSVPMERRFFGAVAGDPTLRDSVMSNQSSFQNLGAATSSVRSLQPDVPYRDEASPAPGEPQDVAEKDALATEKKRNRIMQGYMTGNRSPKSSKRRLLLMGAALAVIILLFLIIFLPIYFTVVKKHPKNTSTSGSGSGSSESGSGSGTGSSGNSTGNPGDGGQSNPKAPITGGTGSTITMEDGTNFTYVNTFGGFWVDDPDDPFNNGARAQSWVPPLNQTWNWSKNRVFGVNLGGWLVTEPFIAPALFEKYNAIDEWTLSQAMAKDTANGGLATILENHYKTFITEQDFANIAAAGLSWVRIPIGFWAIEVRDDEPFLEGVSWKYFLKAIQWARKYGIRIKLDLHSIPGSQNGYNHSGRLGSINFLNGTMGLANAQRSLEYIRILTEFISQPEYSNVVPLFGIVNEAVLLTIGKDILSHFYLEAYTMIRNITGFGANHGPIISIHDGFQGTAGWADYMRGADRLALDSHPYMSFTTPDARPLSQQVTKPCLSWGSAFNSSLDAFGITVAGEWALSFNDCGKWLNGVHAGTRLEGTFPGFTDPVGNCTDWTNWPAYSTTTKANMKKFALNTMDALPHWFFWTWRIGNSSITGKVEAPQWSYSLGLENGWMPTDPRTSQGQCAAAGVNEPFAGPLKLTETGGVATATVDPDFRASYSAWPPSSLKSIDDVQYLPTYTATGTVPTLSPATYTQRNGSTVQGGDGWYNAKDTAQAPVEIQGCNYPPAWSAALLPAPTASVCGPSKARRAVGAVRTPAP